METEQRQDFKEISLLLVSGLTRTLLVTAFVAPSMMTMAPSPSKAASILVAQCLQFTTCWNSPTPTPWSDSLTLSDLMGLGLGTSHPFVVLAFPA